MDRVYAWDQQDQSPDLYSLPDHTGNKTVEIIVLD